MTFDQYLVALGLQKQELAARLGISKEQVSRWKDKPPAYAIAYMECMLNLKKTRKAK